MDSNDHTSLSLGLNSVGSAQFPTRAPKVVTTSFMDVERKVSVKDQETGVVEAEMNRVSEENKRLHQMIGTMFANYSALQRQLADLMRTSSSEMVSRSPSQPPRKRKAAESHETGGGDDNDVNATSGGDSCKKPREEAKVKISNVYVRTDSLDTSLIVNDGYQWRKYGQKVTKDSPFPRAYYRCSFAPLCPVKKKVYILKSNIPFQVQRSAEDKSVLVATYEGEHNHPQPSQKEVPARLRTTSGGPTPFSMTSSLNFSGQPVTLENIKTGPRQDAGSTRTGSSDSPKKLVEQMASMLSKDPNFAAALATAISGRIFELSPTQI